MRKRRRLADKLTIMVCAVLVAVSAFFYAPMDVEASSYSNEVVFPSGNTDFSFVHNTNIYKNSIKCDFLDSSFNDDDYYLLDISFDVNIFLNKDVMLVRDLYLSYGNRPLFFTDNIAGNLSSSFNYSSDVSCVFKGSWLKNSSLEFLFRGLNGNTPLSGVVVDCSVDYTINSYRVLTGVESETYQQGYNAGYSAGEQVGESNGYSNGYSDGFEAGEQSGYDSGFEAGKESVDTQSYYDMGYSAGYDAGYLSGYDDGYDDGYDAALSSLQGSSSSQSSLQHLGYVEDVEKSGTPFYVSSYGLVDMEEYQSGVNGYFYNTVPGTYSGLSYITYEVPFYTLNNNKYPTFNGDSARFQFRLRSVIPSLTVDSGSASLYANLTNSRIREVYVTYKGQKYYGNLSSGTSYAYFDFLVDDFATSGPHTLVSGDMSITFVIENSVTIITDSDTTHFVSAVYTPKVSFDLGNSSNPFTIRSFVINDRVSANIQSQTDSLVNGFNNSHGNSVNNDFSAGLNDFETAEDSLFATATTGLKDFTFFDIQSVPAMVTGMSFVGSIMSGWFSQAGGASGVGIVLSILFSIMLVAMVLGLYRWYQSKGGKD